MGDTYKKIRLAAVQAASEFLDREATVEKACRLIREAGKNGADVIGFPEGFIPTHPGWFNFLPSVGSKSLFFSKQLFKNAVEIPGASTGKLGQACREANIIAVVGVCEKLPGTTGTMWNTQLFIDRSGELLGKHQKLVPTLTERMVHTGGQGSTMRAFQTHFGTLSGLLCGENSNPLAAFALSAHYPVVHVASWPAHFGPTNVMQDNITVATRGLAYQMKCFVINACGVIDDDLIEKYGLTKEDREYVERIRKLPGASIIGPRGQVLAEMREPGDGILYCDVDLEDVLIPKVLHDFVGHYNRPDVFSVALAPEERQLLIKVHSELIGEKTVEGQPPMEDERTAVEDRSKTLLIGSKNRQDGSKAK